MDIPLLGTTPLVGLPSQGGDNKSPEKIREAAQQFEALLIGEMMKSAVSEQGGWLGEGADQGSSSAMDFANEYFARALSSKGGLGLTNIITKGLQQAQDRDSQSLNHSTPSTAPAPAPNTATGSE